MAENWTFLIAMTAALVATVTAAGCPPDPGNFIPQACPEYNDMAKTVHLAHEWDCTKFYKCDGGERVLAECPLMSATQKLHFNPSLQVCDWPECAHCVTKRPANFVEAHPKICAKYYETVEGKKILKKCSNGQHFSPARKICMPPAVAGCH